MTQGDEILVGGPRDVRRFELDGEPVDVAQFIEDNGFAMPDIEVIDALNVGDVVTYGGSATPLTTLKRVTDDAAARVRVMMESIGYAVEDTGGNCQAFVRKVPNGGEILVSNEGSLPENFLSTVWVSFVDSDGNETEACECLNVDVAVAYADGLAARKGL